MYLLIKVLIYNFSSTISLGVKYSKKLNFNFKNTVEFVLEIQYKLRTIVGDN